jgi:RNA polymerase sigma factor (sigma-70 family)
VFSFAGPKLPGVAITRSPTGPRTSRSATSFDHRFEALYARHSQALARYCYALVQDEQDALDVLQNVALRAMLALRQGAQPKRERAWLYAIAYNEAMSLLRGRRPAPPLDEHLMAPAADPLPTILMRERLAELVDDVQELTPRARQMLLMRELGGLRRADIAAALRVSPGAVSQSLSESRAALRVDRAARDLPCDVVRSLLDEPDRCRRTPRTVRAHLRGCRSCRAWARRG